MLLFTLFALACASAVPAQDKLFYPPESHAQHFEEFKVTYNKQYANLQEELYRFDIFMNYLNSINELNAKYNNTVYGITKFSDLTTEEFRARYTGLLVDKNRKPSLPPLLNFSSIEEPDTFDWRDKNVVTSVKNQGSCGSCWTFGITGCLESQYAIKYNKLVDFSEKQLLDCDTFDYGCDGGYYSNVIGYMMAKGMMKDADYPYKDEQETCKYDANKVEVHIKGYESYNFQEEDVIKKVLYAKGPLAISIDATGLMGYKSGVIQDCKHNNINHGVLLVGYGTENGVPYWLIKNSWGEDHGDKGYYKFQRGWKQGCLGISKAAGADITVLLL